MRAKRVASLGEQTGDWVVGFLLSIFTFLLPQLVT
jgi:hypothetical protein